jgi:hypothetical protein
LFIESMESSRLFTFSHGRVLATALMVALAEKALSRGRTARLIVLLAFASVTKEN